MLLCCLFLNTTVASAEPTSLMNIDLKEFKYDINKALEKSKLNDFINEAESQDKLNNLKETATAYQTKEVYVRFIMDENAEVSIDPKFYSENEYELYEQNARQFPTSIENSWMRLNMEIYKLGSYQYEFMVFYNWKTKPFFTFNDVVGLGHDSNINFDNETAYSMHQQIIINPSTGVPNYTTNRYTNANLENCKTTLNGVAFKFNLPSSPDIWAAYYQGYIGVKGEFNGPSTTSGTLEMSYIHSELALNFDVQASINFKPSGEIVASIVGSQDELRWADIFRKF